MSIDPRDPVQRALDELAGLADSAPVADRMSGIARKARRNRARRAAAGAAGVAVVVAGVAGVAQLAPDRGTVDTPGPAVSPTIGTPTTPQAPSPQPVDPVSGDGLTTTLTVHQIGPTTLGVLVHTSGTARSYDGPSYTRVLLDGQEATGSEFLGVLNQHADGGPAVCDPDVPPMAFDKTFTDAEQKGLRVDVPGPGTYEVTVQAPYCDADGEPVAYEVSGTVTVTEPDLVVAEETSADVDGDGEDDAVRLMVSQVDRERGPSVWTVAEVALASGRTTEVTLHGIGLPTVAGEADLDGDGVSEVLVRSDVEDHSWWTVLTYADGEMVAATPVGMGEQEVRPESGTLPSGGYQYTWLREGDQGDGELVSWFSRGPWDGGSDTEVHLGPWVLDGAQVLLGDTTERRCVAADPQTWTDPGPC